MQNPTDPAESAVHRRLAVTFFNETWTLLDKTDRSPAEDARMIHMAHASRMHWELIGTPQNVAVGEWQIARVYSADRQFAAQGVSVPALTPVCHPIDTERQTGFSSSRCRRGADFSY